MVSVNYICNLIIKGELNRTQKQNLPQKSVVTSTIDLNPLVESDSFWSLCFVYYCKLVLEKYVFSITSLITYVGPLTAGSKMSSV